MTKVLVGFLYYEKVGYNFMYSYQRVFARGDCRLAPNSIAIQSGPFTIPEARNTMVKTFLDSDATHLWIIDSDMGFPQDALDKLLKVQEPVVGALCYGMGQYERDGLGGYKTRPFAVMYEYATSSDNNGFILMEDFPMDQPVRVAATGAACLLVEREAFEKIEDNWFSPVVDRKGNIISEDLSFCYRLAVVGIPIYVHTGVKTNHMKTTWI